MEMTKQRKVLAGIMCAGLGLLALDRLVLAPPQTASADVAAHSAASGTEPGLTGSVLNDQAPAEGPEADSAPTLPSFTALNQRLASAHPAQPAQAEPDVSSHDPFALPEQWAPETPAAPDPQPQPQAAEDAEALEADRAFAASHTLEAVLDAGGTQHAVVDRRLLKLGDELSGYRLVRINARWVLWESVEGNRAVIMRLEDK